MVKMTTFFSKAETVETILWQPGDYDSGLVPLTSRTSSETLSHGLCISVDTKPSLHPSKVEVYHWKNLFP